MERTVTEEYEQISFENEVKILEVRGGSCSISVITSFQLYKSGEKDKWYLNIKPTEPVEVLDGEFIELNCRDNYVVIQLPKSDAEHLIITSKED